MVSYSDGGIEAKAATAIFRQHCQWVILGIRTNYIGLAVTIDIRRSETHRIATHSQRRIGAKSAAPAIRPHGYSIIVTGVWTAISANQVQFAFAVRVHRQDRRRGGNDVQCGVRAKATSAVVSENRQSVIHQHLQRIDRACRRS